MLFRSRFPSWPLSPSALCPWAVGGRRRRRRDFFRARPSGRSLRQGHHATALDGTVLGGERQSMGVRRRHVAQQPTGVRNPATTRSRCGYSAEPSLQGCERSWLQHGIAGLHRQHTVALSTTPAARPERQSQASALKLDHLAIESPGHAQSGTGRGQSPALRAAGRGGSW